MAEDILEFRFPSSAASTTTAIPTAAAFLARVNLKPVPDQSSAADSAPVLRFKNGEEIVGAPTILRYIARVGDFAGFYGKDSIAACQVDEWLDYAPTLAVGAEFERACTFIDNFLSFRTFLVGYSLTVADVAVWTSLLVAGQRWEAIRKSPTAKYPFLIRWFNSVLAGSTASDIQDTIAPFLPVRGRGRGAAPSASAEADDGGRKGAGPENAKGGGGGGGGGGKGEGRGAESSGAVTGDMPGDLELPEAEEGKVVTRFPPEPSGFLHVGHAKAALLNQYFAQKYKGKLLIRFDDTNPSKEKDLFVENILLDLETLGIKGDRLTFTSDYFDEMLVMAEKLIKEGKAYVDDTPVEVMREERMHGIESKNRSNSVEENLRLWAEMVAGSDRGRECCLRGKMDMQHANKALRDPVYYRCNSTPHHRVGSKYKLYPTYDFACPYVDSIEGVTHALRSSEYHDRNEQYYRVLQAMGLRKVIVWDFSRLNFQYTLLSKRKLAWFVDNHRVEGWNDPRFPTVQGIVRHGLTVEALKQFILSQGASKNLNLMEMDKLWTMNKKIIDPVCPRHTAVVSSGRVPLLLRDGPFEPFIRIIPRHKKHPPAGNKATLFSSRILLDQADAQVLKEGEEVTLMDWGNAIIDSISKEKDGEGKEKVVAMEGHLHLEGSVKTTKWKLTWLAESEELVPLTLVDLDHLITKKKLEEDEDFMAVLNPATRWEVAAMGDGNMRNLQQGEILQLERKGYFIVDSPFMRATKPLVLIAIPDGRQRPPPGQYAPIWA